MKVRVTRRAQSQIERAARWWDTNRDLAPEAFDEDLAEAFRYWRLNQTLERWLPFPERTACDDCILQGFGITCTTEFAMMRSRFSPCGTPAEVTHR